MNSFTETVHLALTGWHLMVWMLLALLGCLWISWGLINLGWKINAYLTARTAFYQTHARMPARHRAEEQ